VLQTGIQHSIHFGTGNLEPSDVASSIISTVIKDPYQDKAAWDEYLESVIKNRKGWKPWYEAFSSASES